MNTRINLEDNYLTLIKSLLLEHLPGNSQVWVFGSRVYPGKPKKYSDVDLVIDIGSVIPLKLEAMLKEAFSESMLPYKVDIVDWNNISAEFKKNIDHQRVQILP